ncbi:hypothetical protein CMUS01_06937 [Colletotrichum musicola]|uniref:Uncharacterized protein n=1 Tax=Colletotrichum musicola TaxID=2175873 RepID=A0A8H6NHA2_9PEZI|nr:hypothetical protein CMUS01_06937 [Colletotrichum musicola]
MHGAQSADQEWYRCGRTQDMYMSSHQTGTNAKPKCADTGGRLRTPDPVGGLEKHHQSHDGHPQSDTRPTQETRKSRMSSVPTRSVSVPDGQTPIPLARHQTTPGHGEPRASHPFRAVPQDCMTPEDPPECRRDAMPGVDPFRDVREASDQWSMYSRSHDQNGRHVKGKTTNRDEENSGRFPEGYESPSRLRLARPTYGHAAILTGISKTATERQMSVYTRNNKVGATASAGWYKSNSIVSDSTMEIVQTPTTEPDLYLMSPGKQ